jgi:hypothetical protein
VKKIFPNKRLEIDQKTGICVIKKIIRFEKVLCSNIMFFATDCAMMKYLVIGRGCARDKRRPFLLVERLDGHMLVQYR